MRPVSLSPRIVPPAPCLAANGVAPTVFVPRGGSGRCARARQARPTGFKQFQQSPQSHPSAQFHIIT